MFACRNVVCLCLHIAIGVMDSVRAGAFAPVVSLVDVVPLCFCALIGDACQTGAILECPLAYARDAVPDRDAC